MSFSLPLTRDEMQLALRRGLGRALMHVRSNGVDRDRDLILAACLRNQGYDPQCDGSRAEWMLEFLDDGLAAEFLSKMDRPERFWDAQQQAELAYLLARRRQPGAREALYAAFTPHPETADLVGAREILELDGAQGLLQLVRQLRRECPDRLGALVPTLEDHFKSMYGEDSAQPILGEELLHYERDESRWVSSLDNLFLDETRPRRPEFTFDQVWSAIADGLSCGYELTYLGELVGPPLAEAVYQRLGELTQVEPLVRGLKFFTRRGLPEVTPQLLSLANHPSQRVRHFSIIGLSVHRNPEVRSLALRCLRRKRWRNGELRLLVKNFEPGDERWLRLLPISDDHRWIYDLCEVCQANPYHNLLEAMISVYEMSPCLQCRRKVIKVMQGLGRFPDWAAQEHLADALSHSSWW